MHCNDPIDRNRGGTVQGLPHFSGFGQWILCLSSTHRSIWCPQSSALTDVLKPTKEHVVKLAIHNVGYTNCVLIARQSVKISTPRTVTSDPDRGLCIPKDALRSLRFRLREVFPDLALKPFMSTRLCWYASRSFEKRFRLTAN